MGARNQVVPARQPKTLATQFQTRFLEVIPRHIEGLKFSAQDHRIWIHSSLYIISTVSTL
jgi:hypothetical protein